MGRTWTGIAAAFALSLACAVLVTGCSGTPSGEEADVGKSQAFLSLGLETDTSKSSIDIDRVLSGGPEKDGIPSLTDPAFVAVGEAEVPNDEVRGVLLDIEGERRFYPYNIMVWHEIVNDTIAGTHIAVTF